MGCGGDDSGSPAADSGADVTSDVTSDATTDTSTVDSAMAETGSDSADSSTTVDSSDSGTLSDAADAGDALDAADASDAHYTSDAADGSTSSLAAAFSTDEAKLLCQTDFKCCGAGSYDLPRCVSNVETLGWEGTLPRDRTVYSRANITFDDVKAAGCLAAIKTFPCGHQTAAQWSAITRACELIIQGTIKANKSGCISSFECEPNTYCDVGAGGICRPLATTGQPCNTAIQWSNPTTPNPIPDEMCSYLASSQSGRFCDLINNAPDAATCQPLLANGATCENKNLMPVPYYDDQACPAGSALCGDNLQCGGTATYPYSGFCTGYLIVDAGGGG